MRRGKRRAPEPEVELDELPADDGEQGMQREGPVQIPSGWSQKKTGLNDSDINALVRLVRAGTSWADAKDSSVGAAIEDSALEGWKDEIFRRAGRKAGVPVMPPRPAAEDRPLALVGRERLDPDTAELLDVALAALICGRMDLATQALRDAGADAARAPDGWVDRLMSGKPRAPRAAAPAPAREAEPPPARPRPPPAPPARPSARRAAPETIAAPAQPAAEAPPARPARTPRARRSA
jgi:hypothetical protein